MDDALVTGIKSTKATDEPELYNAMILDNYIMLLKHEYPDVNIGEVLDEAGLHSWEVSDPAKWLTQSQVNSFHCALGKKCSCKSDISIAREAGRFSAAMKSKKLMRQTALSLLSPGQVYDVITKLTNTYLKSASWRVSQRGKNTREITVKYKPGVHPEAFQCENTIGSLEAVTMMFWEKVPTIEHSECYFKGAPHCRYVVTWDSPPSAFIKRLRNYIVCASIVIAVVLGSFGKIQAMVAVFIVSSVIISALSIAAENQEKREIIQSYRGMDYKPDDFLRSYKKYYNTAQLVGEISRHLARRTSTEQVVDKLREILTGMGFNRGHIFFVEQDQKGDTTKMAYWFDANSSKVETDLIDIIIANDALYNLPSGPKTISSRHSIFNHFPDSIARSIASKGYNNPIYIPITYEKTLLGFFIIENLKASESLTMGDINMLTIVASMSALFITNIGALDDIIKSEEVKNDFVSVASHEMRTPIQVIIMALDELKFGINSKDQASVKLGLKRLEESANRLNAIANKILDLSKIESSNNAVNIEKAKVADLIEHVKSETDFIIQKYHHSVSYLVGSGVESVFCDINLMVQVMINLINNAAKYTPVNGKLIVEIINTPAGLEIMIIDNGRGIPKNEHQKVFMKFYQIPSTGIESETRGSGLGLSFCKEVIRQHRGYIAIESPLTEAYAEKYQMDLNDERLGSKFIVHLPSLPQKSSEDAETCSRIRSRK